jgi:hypothetical protein
MASDKTICAMLTESEIAQRTRGERLSISLESTRASFTAAIRPATKAIMLGLTGSSATTPQSAAKRRMYSEDHPGRFKSYVA